MLAVGLGIVWGGYLVAFYGVGLVKHYGLTVLDLAVPGYWNAHGPVSTGTGTPGNPINVPNLTPGQLSQPGGQVINPATGLTAPPPGWHLVTNPDGTQSMVGP